MLKRFKTPTLVLSLGFSDKARILKLLEPRALDTRVAVNILKARLSEDFGWLELELKGPSPCLHEVAAILSDAAAVQDPGWRPISRAS